MEIKLSYWNFYRFEKQYGRVESEKASAMT